MMAFAYEYFSKHIKGNSPDEGNDNVTAEAIGNHTSIGIDELKIVKILQ